MMDSGVYDEDYFIRGTATGKSLYTNYRYLPDLTIPMVSSLIDHLGIRHTDTICDFGCARGYTVKAFRELNYLCSGVDLSRWAIDNCDTEVTEYVECRSDLGTDFNWIIAKDVLEHVPNVRECVNHLLAHAMSGVFVVVPLSAADGAPYVVGDYERDITHLHRFTLGTWVDMFLRPGWSVEAAYRVKGVKDNYYKPGWERANGCITARKLK